MREEGDMLILSKISVGPRPTMGAPCQQMLGNWTCRGVLILLVVPYAGLNGFNKELFGDGWRFVDFVHLTLQWLDAFSHKWLGKSVHMALQYRRVDRFCIWL